MCQYIKKCPVSKETVARKGYGLPELDESLSQNILGRVIE